jgi:pimeloyl-ACP methyl ester carboxylesterase
VRGFFAALLCLPLFTGVAIAQPADRREGFVRASDGVRIHYVERGQGTTVVLLHGVTGSAASNYEQTETVAVLARFHRVIAIDFRGHGQSDKPLASDAYRPDRLVEDIIAVLDDLKVERAHLVGYSIGGWTIRRLVSAAPKRVLSATLGGDGAFDGGWRVLGTEDAAGEDQAPPASASKLWGREADSPVYKAFGEGFSKPSAYSDRPPFSTLGIPVLQVLGQFDYPNTRSKLLKRDVSNYRLVVLPGRTHLTALADPGFAEAVSTFVAQQDAR